VRNTPATSIKIDSEDELFRVIGLTLRAHLTDDVAIALKRIGKGVCPKSFPISHQSYYFMDLYNETHGGEGGLELKHLPEAGGVLDQPNIFFNASNVIRQVRAEFYSKKIKDATSDKVHRPTDTEASGRAGGSFRKSSRG
jgi:hypothetical protein